MRNHLATAAVAAFVLAAAPFAAAQTTEGTWTATKQDGAALHLSIIWEPGSQWGQSIPLAELPGLSEGEIAVSSSAPVRFRIEREAGTFELDGVFQDGRGAGHFRFQPHRGFASTLRALGIQEAADLDDHQLMRLALARVTVESVREFRDLGYQGLTVRDLVRMAIHGVTPEFVRELDAAGYSGLEVQELTSFRIHGVTPRFIREIGALGYTALPRRDLVRFRIHGVTADFVRELDALGYHGLSEGDLVRFRIHGVTPSFIREMRELGLADLSPPTLVRMRIHGIDRELVRSRRSRDDS
jgi:hypothetical protein